MQSEEKRHEQIHREYSAAWPVSCCQHKALGLACNPLLRMDNIRARARQYACPHSYMHMCAHSAIIAVSHGTLKEVRGALISIGQHYCSRAGNYSEFQL